MNALSNRIYRLVSRIPRGCVLSYGEIGRIVGTGPRQVAAAMRNCPAGLPWHRVVGAGGKIRTPGEYAWIQQERLMAEGIRFRGMSGRECKPGRAQPVNNMSGREFKPGKAQPVNRISFTYEVYRWKKPR